MKRVPVLVAIPSLGLLSLLQPRTAAAQDPVKVAPDIYKQIFENERVRVLDIRLKAGDKIAKHSHPDHFIYVLEQGKVKISKPDGTSSDAEFKVGEVVWIPAETHWAENIGSTELHAIVVELKETARAKPAPKKK
jgi:quercetin dioxygenase-like cupin family protein